MENNVAIPFLQIQLMYKVCLTITVVWQVSNLTYKIIVKNVNIE